MDAIKTRLAEPRELWWEKGGLTNPAVAWWEGKIALLYQATGDDGSHRLASAVSDDGERFVWLDQPVFEGFRVDFSDRLGVANPRLTVMQKRLWVIFETVATYPPGESNSRFESSVTPWRKRIVISESPDLRRYKIIGQPFSSIDATNGVLLPERVGGRYWLLYSLGDQIFCSSSTNAKTWEGGIRIAAATEDWEVKGIRPAWAHLSERGWIIFYNAENKAGRISIGVLLADRHNPTVVLQRTDQPILTASESWERGSVCLGGGIEKQGSLWLYYGGGGSIGLAKIALESILSHLNVITSPTIT